MKRVPMASPLSNETCKYNTKDCSFLGMPAEEGSNRQATSTQPKLQTRAIIPPTLSTATSNQPEISA